MSSSRVQTSSSRTMRVTRSLGMPYNHSHTGPRSLSYVYIRFGSFDNRPRGRPSRRHKPFVVTDVYGRELFRFVPKRGAVLYSYLPAHTYCRSAGAYDGRTRGHSDQHHNARHPDPHSHASHRRYVPSKCAVHRNIESSACEGDRHIRTSNRTQSPRLTTLAGNREGCMRNSQSRAKPSKVGPDLPYII
jgi:hypothetical protein